MRFRLPDLLSPDYPIVVDYPLNPSPRYGYGKLPHRLLSKIISGRSDQYEATLRGFLSRFGDNFSDIAAVLAPQEGEPSFRNGFFTGLDAVALYGFLASGNPATYFEVGSGFSTKFARRAISDHRLRTTIVSCDPHPRGEIDALADELLRQPLEEIRLNRLEALVPGDVISVDGSHRCFTNSDVSVFFLDILPILSPGVIIHIHDILLPFDYPPAWAPRYYSEQYLLACHLLAARDIDILLPNAFISCNARFNEVINQFRELPEMEWVERLSKDLYHGYLGYSFWFRK